MRIGCVGWGSLVWKPGVLRCVGRWQLGGPELPVEFARTSRDGRLTLVLLEGTPVVPTRFVELDYATPEQAQEALAGREGSGNESIGLWPGSPPKYSVGAAALAKWAERSGFDAVVWSALRPKFRDDYRLSLTSPAKVVAYLRELDAETAARAREYVCRAPAEIRTPFREVIERELGWHPQLEQEAPGAVSAPGVAIEAMTGNQRG